MLSLQATGAAAQTTIDKERYLRRLETALLLQTLNADLLKVAPNVIWVEPPSARSQIRYAFLLI